MARRVIRNSCSSAWASALRAARQAELIQQYPRRFDAPRIKGAAFGIALFLSINLCSPAGLRDCDADNLDRLAASLHWLAYHCRGEPFVDEPSKHLGLEPMGDHEPITGSTERIAGKPF
jgi:hypothetical protein